MIGFRSPEWVWAYTHRVSWKAGWRFRPMAGRFAAMVLIVACTPIWVRAQEVPSFLPGTPRDTLDVLLPGGVYRDTLDAASPQPFQLRPIILPRSERVLANGVELDARHYRIDYRYARLWIENAGADTDPSADTQTDPGTNADADTLRSLIVEYRTLPFRLRDAYRLHDPAQAPSLEDPDHAQDREDAARSGDITRRGGRHPTGRRPPTFRHAIGAATPRVHHPGDSCRQQPGRSPGVRPSNAALRRDCRGR